MPSQICKASLLSFAAFALASFLGLGAKAQTSPRRSAKNVVLVHGAWADGSSWSKLIPLLEAKGLHVIAVQIPLTSLADDVAATKRAIASQDGPVVLVGHSYGGAVITEAGNDPKVVALVYVAAFAPAAGESVATTGKPYRLPPLSRDVRSDAQGFLTISAKGITEDFAQDLPQSEKRILAATQSPTTGAVFDATHYERCLEDEALVVCDRNQRPRHSSRT